MKIDELDDYDGEDWRGWVAGKYDGRYEGTPRHNSRNLSDYQHHDEYHHKRKGKRKVILGLVFLVISFCAISIIGSVIIGSDNYLDIELSMMFYYDIITEIIYNFETQEIIDTILNLNMERIDVYFEEKGIKVQEELKNKRIEDENHRLQENLEREKAELVKRQGIEREYELLIHAYTNEERTKHGLGQLVLDENISNVAILHSQDMLDNDFFEHDNLKGQTPTDRGNILGVSCVKDYGSYYTEGLGENIFYLEGYWTEDVRDNSKIIMEGWMNSKGHRENILEKDYDKIGIGVKFSNSKIYATQNFC